MIELLLAGVLTCANLSWDAPTMNVDGTPIAGIRDYTVFHGAESGNYDTEVVVTPSPTPTLQVCPGVEGERFFIVVVTDANDVDSGPSNEVSKVIVDVEPEAITSLAVSETVFTVVKQPNRFLLLPVGTVPAGTPCDPNNSTNGLGAVPTSAVQWTSPTGSRPVVVVARCDG